MTSPIVEIEVRCPSCDEVFNTWHRASVNLSLGEEWSSQDLDAVLYVGCPKCSARYEKGSLILRMKVDES